MGNSNSCVDHFHDVLSVWMGGAREEEADGAGSSAREGGRCVSVVDLEFCATRTVGGRELLVAMMAASEWDVEQRVETSKSHWSQVTEVAVDSGDEDVEAENWEVWKGLYLNQAWRCAFFRNFGYDFEGYGSDGSLEIGEKFAEGGQAELFHAKVGWTEMKDNEWDWEHGHEWVLKVFKKGTRLEQLHSQWPHGILQFRVEEVENWRLATPKVYPRNFCEVMFGTLLEDGRFAFLMGKEHFDLRTLIDYKMGILANKSCGPFSKEEVEEYMFEIALGMSWLHSHDIVHRDLKASNVLMRVHASGFMQCYVADYECSVGVVGTGFFRAPEILKACEDKSVNKRPELFTKSSDVYSYGMTCYEMLTGQLPFDGHLVYDYSKCIINGKCPDIPGCVDAWMGSLLTKCWHYDPVSRPSFDVVLNTILENSPWIKELVGVGCYDLDRINWVNWKV